MALGFGVIGCGMISRFHARAINDTRGAKLVACTSRNPASAAAFAEEFGVTAHDDLKSLLADPAVLTAAGEALATKDQRPPQPELGPPRDEFLAVAAASTA